MRIERLTGIGGATLIFLPSCVSSQTVEKQNFLYIMTDQQSYYTISALVNQLGNSPYAGNQYFSTPNLDRLVRDGYSFTHCYSANPVSGPSRFALLTGESPKAYGMSGNYSPSGENGSAMLSMIQERAMGNLFRSAGYETVYAGKVHLPWASGVGGKDSIYNEPSAYGFDRTLTLDDREELAETCVKFFEERNSTQPFLFFVSFMNPHDICMSRLLHGNQTIEDFYHNQRELGARRNQLKWRDVYQAMDQTLFDGDSLSRIPDNYLPTEDFPKLDKSKFIGISPNEHVIHSHIWFYYRLVEQVDGMIGQVLDALDRSPYKDNTTIIFTSDHGEMAGSHSLTGKNVPFEECQRVPFIFVGKGIPAGKVDDTPVCNGWDLLPTMLNLAGIPIPEELKGCSLCDRMTTGRKIDRKYLYVESVNTYGVIENGRYKYTRLEQADPELGNEALTDIALDPGEKRNVASASKKYSTKVRELSDVLDRELERYKAQ